MSDSSGSTHAQYPNEVHGPIVPSQSSLASIVVPAVFCPLTILAVAFRFYAQRYSKYGISIDDCVLVGALVFVVALDTLSIWSSLMAGLGWPVTMMGIESTIKFQEVIFAGQLIWGVAVGLIRAGLLLFYRRIFVNRACHRVVAAFLVVDGVWFLAFMLGMFIKYRWTSTARTDRGFAIWLIVHSVLDVIQDLATLCIPLFVVKTSSMSQKSKLLVGSLFVLGFFCVIGSCVRLKYFVDVMRLSMADMQKFADAIFKICVWTVIQPSVALITACLPAYVPAFQRGRSLNRLFRRTGLFTQVDEVEHESKVNLARPGLESHISKTVAWTVKHNTSLEEIPSHLGRGSVETIVPFASHVSDM